MSNYPKMTVNLKHMADNYLAIVKRCHQLGIAVTGVVKATDSFDKSYNEIANIMLSAGCSSVGDSRLNTIKRMRKLGFKDKVLLLRIPMLSELDDLVKYADHSLQSESLTLQKTNLAACKINKKHGVILMVDLGDLREGFFNYDELLKTALKVENDYNYLHLLGIGTNLGCYGAICPDQNNLGQLVKLAKIIESKINRTLEIVSGGATSTLPLIYNQTIPKGINHLRIGEGAVLARDLKDLWKVPTDDLKQGIYTLFAEIVEIKEKPSHPMGKIFIDAFGYTPEYEDIGIRKRALLAVGKRDIGNIEALIAHDKAIKIIGASSDHLIVDVSDSLQDYRIGDIMAFDCYYQAMVYGMQSESVIKEYIR